MNLFKKHIVRKDIQITAGDPEHQYIADAIAQKLNTPEIRDKIEKEAFDQLWKDITYTLDMRENKE